MECTRWSMASSLTSTMAVPRSPRPHPRDASRRQSRHLRRPGDDHRRRRCRDWQSLHSDTVSLDTAGRGKLTATVRYAWDDDYLYILCQQTAKGKDVHEAQTSLLSAPPLGL